MRRVERLITLLAALLNTSEPLGVEEIRNTVPGYQNRDDSSFKRVLQRDITELLAFGIPIEEGKSEGTEESYIVPTNHVWRRQWQEIRELWLEPDLASKSSRKAARSPSKGVLVSGTQADSVALMSHGLPRATSEVREALLALASRGDAAGRRVLLADAVSGSTELPLSLRLSDVLPAVREAGFEIVHLRPTPEGNELVELVPQLLRTYKSGHYSAYEYPPGLTTVSEALIIEGERVFRMTPSWPDVSASTADTLLTYDWNAQAEQEREQFDRVMKESRLLVRVTQQTEVGWEKLIHSIELRIGDRLQHRELFTTLTEPTSIIEHEYRRHGHSDEVIRGLMQWHAERVAALRAQVPTYRFANIAERAAVEEYIRTGYRYREDYSARRAEIEEQVLREIDWLRTYPNYSLGLTNEATEFAFMVKSERVLFEVVQRMLETPEEDVVEASVESEALTEVFRFLFRERWSAIPVRWRDKAAVIEFLEEALRKTEASERVER